MSGRSPGAGRTEIKYWLGEDAARSVLAFVRPFVRRERGQTVTSLYFDTPHLDFYRQHLASSADRFKLRVRWYGDGTPETVYLESKRKAGQLGSKSRSAAPASGLRPWLEGGAPAADLLWFADLAALHRASPRVLTRCRRDSYAPIETAEAARLTLDRSLQGQAADRFSPTGDAWRWRAAPAPGPRPGVLLELKFPGRPPWWMRELAARLASRQVAYSKYVAVAGQLLDNAPPALARGGRG